MAHRKLLPVIPYIGGNGNHMTEHLITSAECLAFYEGMKANRKSAEEAGKILYDAILLRGQIPEPHIPPSRMLSEDQLIERQKRRAQDSQERKYSGDWVYEFIQGDGEASITVTISASAVPRSFTIPKALVSFYIFTAFSITP
jgi:hypothetical protein